MVSPQVMTVLLSVFSSVCFFFISILLPIFFVRMQRINTLMFTQLHQCHQDSNDIWRQLTESKLFTRTRRQYHQGPTSAIESLPFVGGQCCSCQQGPPGPPGPRGKDRPPGKNGMIGLNGRNGYNGRYVTVEAKAELPCQKCPTAPPGPPGYPGRKGPRGSAGIAGKNGTPGTPGRIGPPGPPGVRGAPGELGRQGPPGDAGKVLNGAPPGPQGKPGPVGPRGKAGLPGRDGRPGVAGSPGSRGPQGDRGSKGALGAPGPHGPPGFPGHPGSCAHCPGVAQKESQQSTSLPGAISPSALHHKSPQNKNTGNNDRHSPNSPQPTPHPLAHEGFSKTAPSSQLKIFPKSSDVLNAATSHHKSAPEHSYQGYSVTSDHSPSTATSISRGVDLLAHSPYKAFSAPTHKGNVVVQTKLQRISQENQISDHNNDEPLEPITPESNQARRPMGYSSEQLNSVSRSALEKSSGGFDQPMVRTNKGYNVHLVSSSYGASPVSKSWDAAMPKHHDPANYEQLAPPPPKYKLK